MNETIDQLVRKFEDGKVTRRELVMALSALVLIRPEARAQASAPPISVSTMNHVTLTVSDVQQSVAFYQRIFGLPLVTTQGNEADWSAPAVPVLGIGNGPQFIAFSRGDRPHINHFCLGMDGFDAGRVVNMLAEHGIEARVRLRGDSDPPAEELMFRDPGRYPGADTRRELLRGVWCSGRPV